jgi:glycosyltransferase involved in cell wall biosynthesis
VARHELDGVVSFTGAVAHVERYLAAADVLVLPSFREGMPNCLIEAMACGIPCVAPPTAGGDEILANGAGDVPPSNDPAHLLAALIDLHDRPDRRATLATAGQLAISRLAPETVAATYEALYQEVGL